jgi:hypothetical protein
LRIIGYWTLTVITLTYHIITRMHNTSSISSATIAPTLTFTASLYPTEISKRTSVALQASYCHLIYF